MARALLLVPILALAGFLPLGSQQALACKFRVEPWHEVLLGWRQACAHTLCGRVVEPVAMAMDDKSSCAGEREMLDLGRELARAADGRQITMLGEVHDNAEQHRLRALLVTMAVSSSQGTRTAAVFEHIRAEQKAALETFAATPGSADDLFAALNWDKSGWPDKKLFAPLYEAVIAAKLPIYAGDPSREMIKKVAKEGEAALPEEERQRLGLDKPLPAASQEALLDDLEKSHCGLMPKKAFGKLAYAQRYRDATLADAVLTAANEHGSAILFAGNGHVRADRGVPWYIRQRAPEKKVVTVMLVEVEDGKTKPEDYDLKGDDGKPVADFVVFTPRAERPDPCEDMKKMFEKKKGG